MIVVYFRLEYVSCTILQTCVLELTKGVHSGGDKNLHSAADEEENTELRFISCCTKVHISSFSGGSTNPRFDDRTNCKLASAGIPNAYNTAHGFGTCPSLSFFMLIERNIICISLS